MTTTRPISRGVTHKRHPTVRTRAVCSVGYTWPSSVLLTDEDALVTCPACLDRLPEVYTRTT